MKRTALAVGVIPARWGSTRLPGKSLLKICGRPVIEWVIEEVRRAELLSDVLVATDDRRIAAVVEALGVRAVMTRSDHPSGTDRIAEAIQDTAADVVINVQGDEPFIDPLLINRLAETMVSDPDWDMATAAVPIRTDLELAASSVVKVVWDRQGRALYFSRSVIPFVRDETPVVADGVLHWRHLGVYAYRRPFLTRMVQTPPCALEQAEKLEQLRALDLGARIAVLKTESTGIGIDTPEDVPQAEKLMRERLMTRGLEAS